MLAFFLAFPSIEHFFFENYGPLFSQLFKFSSQNSAGVLVLHCVLHRSYTQASTHWSQAFQVHSSQTSVLLISHFIQQLPRSALEFLSFLLKELWVVLCERNYRLKKKRNIYLGLVVLY